MLPYSLTRSLRIDVAFTSIPFSSSSRSATLFSADTLDLAELSDDNELAGFVDELMPVTLPVLGVVLKANSQNGNPSKINPEKWPVFRAQILTVNLTSFHQRTTTNSPQKNDVQPPVFAKTPSKNEVPPPPKNYR
jgi:hypothetical protein